MHRVRLLPFVLMIALSLAMAGCKENKESSDEESSGTTETQPTGGSTGSQGGSDTTGPVEAPAPTPTAKEDTPEPEKPQDEDFDGLANLDDNCPLTYNPNQVDTDDDGWGDACDEDKDDDGILNEKDNCPLVANPSQSNSDKDIGGGDSIGDACDTDRDNDEIADDKDNCPDEPNHNQTDTDEDGKGDACDDDIDDDGMANDADNCPYVANFDQADTDNDGTGDACVNDADGDGVMDDKPDNCKLVANKDQKDVDKDEIGDLCDDDNDNDGIKNNSDNCPLIPNAAQLDADADGEGDACDEDIDGDGFLNDMDNCPYLVDATNNAAFCNDTIDGDITTILNAPVLWMGSSKEYAADPAGVFYPGGVTAVQYVKGENFSVIYFGQGGNVYRALLDENGDIDYTNGISKYGNTVGNKPWYQVRSIIRIPDKLDYLLLFTETYKTVKEKKMVDDKEVEVDVPYYDFYLRTLKIDMDDYGNILTGTEVAYKLESNPKYLTDVPTSVASSLQGEVGVFKKTKKEIDETGIETEKPDGYMAYISRPTKKDEKVLALPYLLAVPLDDKLKVITKDIKPILPTEIDDPQNPPKKIQMERPSATYVDGDTLYASIRPYYLLKLKLNYDGMPAIKDDGNPDFSIIYSTSIYRISGFAKFDGYPNYLFMADSGNHGLYYLRGGEVFQLTFGGFGYASCKDNCGSKPQIRFYQPTQIVPVKMGVDKNRLIIVDIYNRSIRYVDVSIGDGATATSSGWIAGKVPAAQIVFPKSNELTNFYAPYSIRIAQKKGSSNSCAYIGAKDHHMLWLAKLSGDKVVSVEPIATSSTVIYPNHMELVDAGTEWRLYVGSHYSEMKWPRIYLWRMDPATCMPKASVPEQAVMNDAVIMPLTQVFQLAVSPDKKFMYFTGKDAVGTAILARMKLNTDGTIDKTSYVNLNNKFLSDIVLKVYPYSITTYATGEGDDAKQYLLVGDQASANTPFNIHRAQIIDGDGNLEGKPTIIMKGIGPPPASLTPTFAGIPWDNVYIYYLSNMRVVDGKLIASDSAAYSRMIEMDLSPDAPPKVKLLGQANTSFLKDGNKQNFGSNYGFMSFDVWRNGDDGKGLLITDYYLNAIRLMR